jgi:hypothetical protein
MSELAYRTRRAAQPGLAFTYYDSPELVRLNPLGGPLKGGTTVTLEGSLFAAHLGVSKVKCLFDGVAVQAIVSSPIAIVCTAPPSSSIGPKAVLLTLNGVDTHKVPVEFTYYEQARLAALMPMGAPSSGGTMVTLSGFNFQTGLGAGRTALDGNLAKITSAAGAAVDVQVQVLLDSSTMVMRLPKLLAGVYSIDITLNAQDYWLNRTALSAQSIDCAPSFVDLLMAPFTSSAVSSS